MRRFFKLADRISTLRIYNNLINKQFEILNEEMCNHDILYKIDNDEYKCILCKEDFLRFSSGRYRFRF